MAACWCSVAGLHAQLLCFIDSDAYTTLFMIDMTTTVTHRLLVFILGVTDSKMSMCQ